MQIKACRQRTVSVRRHDEQARMHHANHSTLNEIAPRTQAGAANQRQPHILVVDDECGIRDLLPTHLQGQGFRVTVASDVRSRAALMASDPPDLVLLELRLPGEDGMTVARSLARQRACGVVIVTGRAEVRDRILGLELGADDYITKPFDVGELTARIRAVLRRIRPDLHDASGGVDPRVAVRLCLGGWTIDLQSRCVTDPSGREAPLTSGEFDLLWVLARNVGRVLSRHTLIDQTRGHGTMLIDRTIDVQVSRLRKKLAGRDQPSIVAVRSVGYKLVVRAPTAHASKPVRRRTGASTQGP
jgi:two-component system OmpR family response regulator